LRKALKDFAKGCLDYARPTLITLSCEAVGGDVKLASLAGEALILICGAFELHDDIIDKSYVRGPRRRKTILGKYGVNVALLAGDGLLIKGFSHLSKLYEASLPKELARNVIDLICECFTELGSAEALELKFFGSLDIKLSSYLRVLRLKAADVEAYTRIGALLGGGSREEVEALGRYGRLLGMMVIVRDELKDLLEYGSELLSRIRNEYLPLPLIYALNKPGFKDQIKALLSGGVVDRRVGLKLVRIAERSGGINYALRLLKRLGREALEALKPVKGNVEPLKLLVEATIPC